MATISGLVFTGSPLSKRLLSTATSRCVESCPALERRKTTYRGTETVLEPAFECSLIATAGIALVDENYAGKAFVELTRD